jgi:hypothetical protein
VSNEGTAPEGSGKRRTCFVIGPIGKDMTPTRDAADWLLQGIIKPVLEADEFGFRVHRADEGEPGMITPQIIAAVMESDLVIADLREANANAFYELAIRHMEELPAIHMIHVDQSPPFDLKDYRAIPFSVVRPAELERAKAELAKQVRMVFAPGYKVTNPITHARGHRKLADSADPIENMVATLSDNQSALSRDLHGLVRMVARLDVRLGSVERLSSLYNQLGIGHGGFTTIGVPGSSSALPGLLSALLARSDPSSGAVREETAVEPVPPNPVP